MADFKTESQKFLSRSGWTLAARGAARVKLHLIQCPLSCDLWLVGAAFACIPLFFKRGSRDLPGQSRLKTAPTIVIAQLNVSEFLQTVGNMAFFMAIQVRKPHGMME